MAAAARGRVGVVRGIVSAAGLFGVRSGTAPRNPNYGYEVFWKLVWNGGGLFNLLAALIPNLVLVLTLPALRGRPGGRRRRLRWVVATVGLVTLAMAFLMPTIEIVGNGWEPVFARPGIGFRAWSLSFVCAASALWIRDRGRAAVKVEESTAV